MNIHCVMSVKDLLVVNKNSISLGYNRTFRESPFLKQVKRENGTSKKGALLLNMELTPLMKHSHRGGEPCDPHLRVLVQLSPKSHFVVDMTFDDFDRYRKPF